MSEENPSLQIVGLGMSTLDILIRVEHMPGWERTTHLEDLILDGGGPAGTGAAAAARLGARAGMITTAGNDATAAHKLRLLEKYGVDISHCITRAEPEAQVILVYVNALTGERVFYGSPHTDHQPLRPEEIDRDYITQADFLLLDGFFTSAALQAARWMRAAGKHVVLDAARTNAVISTEIRELVCLSDILICGAGFSHALSGIKDIFEAGKQIINLGPSIFVETLGENGSITVTEETQFHTPAYPVAVIDTTGAGDVFHGAYLIGLLKGWDLVRVAQFASAAAALKCKHLGGRSGIPPYCEVIKFLSISQPDFKE